ncbi:hypothetical protein Clacol_006836 [Clathrus columnatus]|uniref:MFS general substrate transporter n=1 Tax=Clathrus columnatus TaxID=1419009 RepID=A0AAV5AHI6_9AGAM|nr:hypothetical protein Clacol_006836 [Clathrus columnatus]
MPAPFVNAEPDPTITAQTDPTAAAVGESSRERLIGSNFDSSLPKYGSASTEGTGLEDLNHLHELELEERARRPFYRRPSPWWIIMTMAIAAIVFSTLMAPRVDVYTTLVCERLKPEVTASYYAMSTTRTFWRSLPRPPLECVQDPEIQALVAKLNTIISATSGLLGCLTVGWWGQFSDRHGRIPMFVISASGLLITDLNFILVAQGPQWFPGGYNFLVVGAVLGGIFGGAATFMAVAASYIADTSPPELRARNLSLKTGLLLSGIAIGPAVGSYIVNQTDNLLSVFYIAFFTHIVFIFVLPLAVPESVTKASILKSRQARKEAIRKAQQLASQDTEVGTFLAILKFSLGKIFAFARPMSILLPHRHIDGKGWDYNLTLVAMTMAVNLLTMSTGNKHFISRELMLSPFNSFNEFTDGTRLQSVKLKTNDFSVRILVHYLIIHVFKPKPPPPIQLPGEESLLAEQEEILIDSAPSLRSPSRSRATHHTASFDYKLTFFAIFMEVITYLSMSLSRTPLQYTVASMMGGMAGGFTPAIKSVAMSLYEQGPHGGAEVGRLFGALGIVEALSGSALAPIIMGAVFVKTVGTFPQAIYLVALAAVVVGAMFFSFIRLRATPRNPRPEVI